MMIRILYLALLFLVCCGASNVGKDWIFPISVGKHTDMDGIALTSTDTPGEAYMGTYPDTSLNNSTYTGDGVGKVYKTTDYGETWADLNVPGTCTQHGIISIDWFKDTSNNQYILIGTWVNSNYVGVGDSHVCRGKSTDGGTTWSWTNGKDASDPSNDLDFDEIDIPSVTYTRDGICWAGGTCGEGNGKRFKSTDYGYSWTSYSASPDDCRYTYLLYFNYNNTDVLLGGGKGVSDQQAHVYRCTNINTNDPSTDWVEIDPDPSSTDMTIINDFVYCGNGVVLLFGGGGGCYIYRSTDSGQTWTKINHGLGCYPGSEKNSNGVKGIDSAAYLEDGVVVAVMSDLEIIRSGDNGLTWERIGYHAPEYASYGTTFLGGPDGVALIGGRNVNNDIMVLKSKYPITVDTLGIRGGVTMYGGVRINQ